MPLDANSKSEPPKRYVFFVDRSLGKQKVAGALRGAGAEVHVHDEHFPTDAPDEEWLAEVGRRGWIVLTKDRRIRYRSPALRALRRARARAFVLTSGNLSGAEMGQIFVRALHRMTRFAGRHPAPFVARVTKGGSVSMIFSGT